MCIQLFFYMLKAFLLTSVKCGDSSLIKLIGPERDRCNPQGLHVNFIVRFSSGVNMDANLINLLYIPEKITLLTLFI